MHTVLRALFSLGILGLGTGLGVACGGRGESGATGPSNEMSSPDAGNPRGEGFEELTAPPGTRIIVTELEPQVTECQTDLDCAGTGAAASCAALSSSYRVCVPEAPVATAPSSNPTGDECDSTRPCTVGACYQATLFASGQCGLGGASLQNACRSDSCDDDADCGAGLCGPPGVSSEEFEAGGAIRQCFAADCREDADCALVSGGVCALVASSCGGPGLGKMFRPAQLACVYPGGCARDADCMNGVCSILEGTAVCLEVAPY